MTDPFVDRITRAQTDKGETVSGRMVETRSQKSSGEQKAMLEGEVHTDQATNENQDVHGPGGRDRRLASEQGHDFAPSTGILDREKSSRQRVKARISTSTKLPGTDRVTPPLVTPLVDNWAALEEAVNNIVDSIEEQNEQITLRMSELERAVHIEEINRNRQEVGRSEKRLKERTDKHIAKNLSRMTREAEQRELHLRDDMEKLRIQQEQSFGTLDTKIDAMMERRTQAIMDRLDGLLGSKSEPKEGETNSGGPSREPKVNFNDHQRRRTYGSTRGKAVHQAKPQGIIEHGARTVE